MSLKRNLVRAQKPALESALEGGYAIEVPDGTYTFAVTDREIPAAKPSSGDLFALQYDSNRDLFVPRVFRLRVNGNTSHNEAVVPRGTDLEFLWTVLSGKVVRYDYNNITFYIDIGPARKDWIPTTNGKLPTQTEIDNVVGAINEFVRLDTNGKVTPRIEVGTNPPKDDVVNPKNGTLMVEPEYALFFWDSKLPIGALGTGAPFVDDSGRVTSSFARVMPGVGYNVVINEVLGAAGLHGEPGTDKELNARIRNTGGSIFLDGNTGPITERDAQIIKYHGTRPIGTTPNDNSNRIVNE